MPPSGKRKSKRAGKSSQSAETDYEVDGDRRELQYADSELMNDEIDEFHSKRDKVLLGGDDYDDDFEDDGTKKPLHAETTGVMDIGDDSDADNFDGNDDEDDHDDIQDDVESNGEADSDDVDDDDDEDVDLNSVDGDDEDPEEMEERISSAWGKGRDQFYDTDYVDPDYKIQEDELDMAKEEEREALRMQARRLAEQSDDVYDLVKFTESQTKKSKKNDGKMISLATKEKIVKDLSSLTHDERLAVIAEHAPELLDLCEELRDKSEELENVIKPALIKHAMGTLELHESGLGYLQLRHRLLLSYMLNIGYYMYLRSCDYPTAQISVHPCITQLVKLRTVFDDLDTLHQQLEPELKMFVEASDDEDEEEDEGDDVSDDDVENDVGSAVVGNEHDDDDDDDDEEEEFDEYAQDYSTLLNTERNATNTTHTNTDTPSSYAEVSLSEARRQGKSISKRARKSERKRGRVANDFGDAALGDDDMGIERSVRRQEKAHNRHANAPAKANKKAPPDVADDNDDDHATNNNQKPDPAAAAFYETVEKANAMKKEEKIKLKKLKRDHAQGIAPEDDGRFGASTDNRAITWAMQKNKGLTPSRKKEVRNPRVRNKNKFTKATKRRKGTIQTMRNENSRYTGEQFGIRSDLTKSVKLK